MFKLQLRN